MRRSILLLPALILASCGGGEAPAPKQAAQPRPAANQPMPEVWRALFDTSQGSFIVEVHKDWAPVGAERFWRLVNMGFFNDSRFFRVRPGFIVQFGLSGDPQTQSMLNSVAFDDDPPKQKNTKGTIAFAQAGPRSRRTQVFVNLKDNAELNASGFAPFGEIKEGFDVFAKLFSSYGEWDPPGSGPNANRIQTEGNAYLDARFPKLDRILRAKVIRQQQEASR